ncbi:MAG: FHA domain-containing protein [Nitrospinae bacterium]|nr:FHA domain-containing protein [Nitrospinota bacterium]
MAKLIISTKDKRLQEIDLKKSVTVGREVGDIMIKNPAVSARHLKIEKDGERFTVVDLGSTNGTFVNNEKIGDVCELKHGDVITVGKFFLTFENPKAKPEPEEMQGFGFDDLGGRTMIMDASAVQAMMPPKEAAPDPGATQKVDLSPKLFLLQPSGAPKVLKLVKETTLIGSGDNADVQIKGLTIGRIAASIVKKEGAFHITHQGGMSKLRVNGSAVETHTLVNGDKFTIGSFNFEFRTEL